MRVITGTAKGRKLKPVPGDSTRPISDRVKVALFDMLAGELEDASLLDLFAGTGGVGIEALSRGARRAVFVDSEAAAVRTISDNLETTGLAGRAQVVRSDAFQFLERRGHESFAIVYIAPPQYEGLWMRAIQTIDHAPDWLTDDGLAVVQIDPREYRPLSLEHLMEIEERKYGNTLLVFFTKPGA
jgi:16S rRNA (guanine966-N2)-methyltransferase